MKKDRGKVSRFPTFWKNGHLTKIGTSYFADEELPKKDALKACDHVRKCDPCARSLGEIFVVSLTVRTVDRYTNVIEKMRRARP